MASPLRTVHGLSPMVSGTGDPLQIAAADPETLSSPAGDSAGTFPLSGRCGYTEIRLFQLFFKNLLFFSFFDQKKLVT